HLDSDSYLTYAYFDEVRVRPEGVQVDEIDGNRAMVQLHADWYRPGVSATRALQLSFSGFSYDDPSESGIMVATDLSKYIHYGGTYMDFLLFKISTVAWTEGAASWGPRHFIGEVTLTVSLFVEQGSAQSFEFTSTYGFNLLPSSGYDPLDPVLVSLGGLRLLVIFGAPTGVGVMEI
ncbi:MAG: hypothetical protein ACE5HJ_08085, partial [Thermoplasmata archaeon]